MTRVEISLPDELAEEARRAGLLSSPRIEMLLREELRAKKIDELFATMDRLETVPDPARMSPEEVSLELRAMRAERRAKAAR
jgi:hypothetical protein